MDLFKHTNVLLILMWPHFTILMCYWFLCDLIPAYRCVIDSHVISFQHTNVLLFHMWPHSSILTHKRLSCDFIPAYWHVIDSHVTSFQHTESLLILTWTHFILPMWYWFSCDTIPEYRFWYWFWFDLIPAYWCFIDTHATIFQHTDMLLILISPYSSILTYWWFWRNLILAC